MMNIQTQVALSNTKIAQLGSCSRGVALSKPKTNRKTVGYAAAPTAPLPSEPIDVPAPASVEARPKAFPFPIPMDSQQKMLSSIPGILFMPTMAACVAGAGLAGNLLGRALPVEEQNQQLASYALTAVGAAAAGAAAVQAKKKRDSASIVDLYNKIAVLDEPSELTQEDVKRVGDKYGISMHNQELDGCLRIFGQYVENIIPAGDEQLNGDEIGHLIAFKNALSLSDEDAAPVFLDIGRRLQRVGIETKNRQQQYEQQKAFSRLVYLSYVVFGDQKAAFLLPWRQRFNMTDAQVLVARRDNAKAIFRRYMETHLAGHLPADIHQMRALRVKQQEIKLFDETAQEMVKEYGRKYIEGYLKKAVDIVRATGKSRDLDAIVKNIDAILEYNSKFVSFSGDEDLIPGLGSVSVAGGDYGVDTKARDLREVYKTYLDALADRDGEYSVAVETAAKDLAGILCIGQKDAHIIQQEVGARLYKRLLREEVTSRRLDQASDPAAVLQSMCQKVRFPTEAAAELHKQLYKQKMDAVLEKKHITDGDAADLERIQRILCIPSDAIKAVQKETSGRILEDVLGDVFLQGAKPIGEQEAEHVDKVIRETRMDRGVAFEVFSKCVTDKFRSYVTSASKDKDKKAAASTVKKLVQFNSLVVTPILASVKGDVETSKKELADIAAKGGATASRSFDEDRRAQAEISLKNEMDSKSKAELYRNYMVATMSGDRIELPVGGVLTRKTSDATRMAETMRLGQLADVLGMSEEEVGAVHHELAEDTFRSKVQDLLRTGPLNDAKAAQLDDIRSSMNLPADTADRVIKGVQAEMYGQAATMEEGGRWTLERVLDMAEKNVNIENTLEEVQRRNLFRNEVEKQVSCGKGDLDPEFMLKKLPQVLVLEEKKVNMIVKELVGSRKRMLLVQAVSQHRQKRTADVLVSLNNLISASRLMPDEQPMAWNEKAELRDIFQTFCMKEDDASKRATLQKVLGLTDDEVAEMNTTRSLSGKDDEEVESFF